MIEEGHEQVDARRAAALYSAVHSGLLRAPESIEDKPLALFYDLNAWESNLANLRKLFGSHWLHACAVKTNPVNWFLQREKELGHGAECASIAEVLAALEAGFAPHDVVFDSPCKTLPEIRYALERKVHLNLDNLQELDHVKSILGDMKMDGNELLGLRVNPLVGEGSIAEFSVSTGKSKFGVPLSDKEDLVKKLVEAPFLNCIHVHTGSVGMGLEQLIHGVRVAVDFAKDVNHAAGYKQISVIDIGGGLATNFEDDELKPTFASYAAALRQAVPELFNGYFDRVISEFGASCHIKFGWLASRIQYTKDYDGGRIAIIHAGSELLLRACYSPKSVKHRVVPFDAEGRPKADANVMPHDIAGPLCFAGDVVAHAALPAMDPGDIIMLLDAGGNTLSLHTTHCSRQMPLVIGYRTDQANGRQDSVESSLSFDFEILKAPQTIQDTLRLWQ